jgi:hypothetical protein
MFGSTSVMPIAVPKKKITLLPLLTVLFVLSYGLMTMLIVEQGSVIQSQRNLIKVLGRDSNELWTAKGKAIGDQESARVQGQSHAQAPSAQGQAPAQPPATQNRSTESPLFQAPATQKPSTQAPSTQTPSTQAVPQNRAQSRTGKIAKPETQLPPIPAADLSDRRRSLNSI